MASEFQHWLRPVSITSRHPETLPTNPSAPRVRNLSRALPHRFVQVVVADADVSALVAAADVGAHTQFVESQQQRVCIVNVAALEQIFGALLALPSFDTSSHSSLVHWGRTMGKVTFLPTPQRRDREVTRSASPSSPAVIAQLQAIGKEPHGRRRRDPRASRVGLRGGRVRS